MPTPRSRSGSRNKSTGDAKEGLLASPRGSTRKEPTSSPGEDSVFAISQERLIIGALFCGYFGREFCTLHLYTTSKLWQIDSGVSDKEYSFMLAVGHVVGASAKVGFGVLTDSFLSGKSVFLIAALGSAMWTFIFGLANTEFEYFVVWLVMHVFIPGCWVGLVSVVAESVATKRHGKTMAFVSLAFVGGDAFVRAIYGSLLKIDGFGWREVFYFGGIIGALTTIPTFLFIKPKTGSIAGAAPTSPPISPRGGKPLVSPRGKKERKAPPGGRFATLSKLLQKPAFILVCLLSFMLRGVRSFFMSFTVPFLVEVSCRSTETTAEAVAECLSSADANSRAVLGSVLFPLTGVFSTVLCGILKDRLGLRHRALIPIAFLSLSLISLAQLALLGGSTPWIVALGSLIVTGFGLFGPYTLLAGAFAIDVGGEGGAATASALIDSSGTIGSICIIALKGFMGSDWVSIFGLLVVAAGIAVLISFRLLALDRCTYPQSAVDGGKQASNSGGAWAGRGP